MADIVPIGLQLYSLREEMGQDFEGTVRKVAEKGYVGVEPYGGLPVSHAEAAQLFKELGLEVFNSHVPFPKDADADKVSEIIEAYSLSQIAIAFLPAERFASIDDVKASCALLNEANEFAKSKGVKLGYHNHWWEYKTIDGQATLDLMLSELDDSVFFEVDTYWVEVGGLNTIELLNTLGSRAHLLHLKDGPISDDRNVGMVAVGDGKMDIPAIVSATKSRAEWYIVELDRCDSDMMTAVLGSYDYLVGKGFARGKV